MNAEPSSTTEALRRALATSWVSARPTALARVALLRDFAHHHDGSPGVTARDARTAAHMLKGGLGAYGLGEASRVAGDIETVLAALTDDAGDVAAARSALRGPVGELDALLAAERPS